MNKNIKKLAKKAYAKMKNPENIFMVLVLIISLVFYSGLRQIPVFEKYDGEAFDWLASQKAARTLLFVESLFIFLNHYFSII